MTEPSLPLLTGTPWASDGVYPVAGDAYDGQPTIIRPSEAEITRGFRPKKQVPAEHLNFVLQELYQANEGVVHAAIRQFTRGDVALGNGVLVPVAHKAFATGTFRDFEAVAAVGNTSGIKVYGNPEGPAYGPTFETGGVVSAAGGKSGVVVAAQTSVGSPSRHIKYTLNYFLDAGIQVTNVAPVGNTTCMVHYLRWVSTSGRFLCSITGTTTTARVKKSDDNGVTWSDCSTGLTSTNTFYAFADNGTETVVALVWTGTITEIWRSTDSGATWTVVSGISLSTNKGEIVYIVGFYFCIITDAGRIILSDDGGTWGDFTVAGLTAAAGVKVGTIASFTLETGRRSFANVGSVLSVLSVTASADAARSNVGLLYSLDSGQTWFYIGICNVPTAGIKTDLKVVNKRFMVSVYDSALVETVLYATGPLGAYAVALTA